MCGALASWLRGRGGGFAGRVGAAALVLAVPLAASALVLVASSLPFAASSVVSCPSALSRLPPWRAPTSSERSRKRVEQRGSVGRVQGVLGVLKVS